MTDEAPKSVREAFGHDETCNVWREDLEGHHLDYTRRCTCGVAPVPETYTPVLRDENKRIVLEHTTGMLAGCHSIQGLQRDAPDPLPEILPSVKMIDHEGPASLVAVKRSYVLYREIYAPSQMQGRVQPGAPFDARQA